jgi:uncharacterized protein (DUF2267 family)
MTIPATLSHSVQQCQEWLKELRDNADLASEAEAWSVLRAVLHQLRDRLTADEAVQFAAQLPLVLRGVFYEGWRPRHAPDKSIRTRRDFLDALTMRLLPHPFAPEPMARAVFALLAHHLDPGEVADVIGQLPDDIKELWPLAARTFRERIR